MIQNIHSTFLERLVGGHADSITMLAPKNAAVKAYLSNLKRIVFRYDPENEV